MTTLRLSVPCPSTMMSWRPQPGRICSQRRQEKFQHTIVKPSNNTEADLPLAFQMPDNINEMQKADPSLVSLFQKAKEKEPGTELDFNSEEYILQNGILYRQ